MLTVAVANRKGGVGKSTVAVNLAAAFALEGRRVLVVDMDSQGSATATLLAELAAGAPTTAHILVGSVGIRDVVRPATRAGIDIVPSSKELTHAQLSIVSKTGRETILKRALRDVDGYDVVLIDTPPEQNLATVNALVAATHVLMPFTPDPMALQGLQTTAEALVEISRAEVGQPVVAGIVQVAYDRRLSVTEEARAQVARAYGKLLVDTTIRANSTFVVCPAWHSDIFALERTGKAPRRGSEDFQALAREVAGRIGLSPAAFAAA